MSEPKKCSRCGDETCPRGASIESYDACTMNRIAAALERIADLIEVGQCH